MPHTDLVATWREIGERVFVRRHPSYDLNVGLIVGDERCAVIDTRAARSEGTELAAAVRDVTALPWVVVNTHAHFDHFLGNVAFPDAPIWSSRRCAEVIATSGAEQRDTATDGPEDMRATPVVAPTHTFATTGWVDLGGRAIELAFRGRGHTDNDIVVTVPDAATTFAGDLVEEGAPPAFGDSYPLDWPVTLDTLIGFTYLPARLITVMSFGLAAVCLMYLAFSLANWFWRRAAPPGWMTEVALLMLLGAMILFALGIVSEYLLRILDEARKRPPYVVERVVGHTDQP